MLVVALLFGLAQCGPCDTWNSWRGHAPEPLDTNPCPDWDFPYLEIDLMVGPSYDLGWFERFNRERIEKYVPGAGTTCRIYVRNMDSEHVISRNGFANPWAGQSTEKWTQQMIFHRYWNPMDINLNNGNPTYMWTDCQDALLADWFMVKDSYGNHQYWGNNDHKGWCLSGDRNDKQWFNDVAHFLFSPKYREYWRENPEESQVVDDDCYSLIALYPDGSMRGWHPPYASSAPHESYDDRTLTGLAGGAHLVTEEWHEAFENGRRTLEEEDDELPSKKDHRDCVLDPKRSLADCDKIVNKIFDYVNNHEEQLILLKSKDEDGKEEEPAETNEDSNGDGSTSSEGASNTLRRLLEKLQRVGPF